MRIKTPPKTIQYTTHHFKSGEETYIDVRDYKNIVEVYDMSGCGAFMFRCDDYAEAVRRLYELNYKNIKRISFTRSVTIILQRDEKEETSNEEENPKENCGK
jgi:hypothetical protein